MTCKRLAIVLLAIVALYTLFFIFTYFGTPSFRIRKVPG